ncbi:MAG: bifunctional diaminohydroxyphosphoribosylaminopyrimidine deaminase/5-amino-6-(5-phosphoribosylamino)uracil reductase RibD [Paramuribaculum sp.]|nr:bifunctional diaminohydroxyphosphoribosylaminopyrimidine deaminase/5-amino-6-(5-phosphoribosylamino)uracil reductase RibD [Paramuribaculum sp.]
MEVDKIFMARALQLAALGRGHTRSNPMVGAVIVGPDGNIIGEGYHRRFGGPHAEVNAIASVRRPELLSRSTIYVTLEPCSHYGKTPPCAKLLVDKKIPRVVIGSTDPNEKVAGRGIAMLREAGAEVVSGVLEDECRALNRPFMTAHTHRRPYILLKWAQSADGYMDRRRTADNPAAARFSGALSQMMVHRLRAQFDAIMVGSGTVIADNPRLDTRLWPGNSPRRIILDRRNRLSADCNALSDESSIHITDRRDLLTLMHDLFSDGITSLMVEGGATLLRSFIDAGLWDDARIEISPVILGRDGTAKAPQMPSGRVAETKIDGNNIITISNFN